TPHLRLIVEVSVPTGGDLAGLPPAGLGVASELATVTQCGCFARVPHGYLTTAMATRRFSSSASLRRSCSRDSNHSPLGRLAVRSRYQGRSRSAVGAQAGQVPLICGVPDRRVAFGDCLHAAAPKILLAE